MPEEYKLLARLPFSDPESEAVSRIATALATPSSPGPEGAPEVHGDGVLVYGFVPDEVDLKAVSDLFGLDINLTLVFADPVAGEQDDELVPVVAGPVAQAMVKASLALAAVTGARGTVITDYTATSVVLTFENGAVTLNQDWAGWQARPEVLALVPEPRRLENLRGRN